MKTLREKISFILTASAYLLIHLGRSPVDGSIVIGTLMALLNTLPYDIGLSYLVVVFIRRSSGGTWPPWDRILRIFFTVGIIFGLIYSLYVRGAIEQERQQREGDQPRVSAAHFSGHDTRKVPLHWA
jgi:hypothetical protein